MPLIWRSTGNDVRMLQDHEPWYAVRCVVQFPTAEAGEYHYEERITLWRADSFESAIARAIAESEQYASDLGGENTTLAQAFHLAVGDDIDEGAEVFSLIRDSSLSAQEYVDQFFDTGTERQGIAP